MMFNPMMNNFGMGMNNNMGMNNFMGFNNNMGMNNFGIGMNNNMGMNNFMGMNNNIGMNNNMGMNNMGMGMNNFGMGMNNMGNVGVGMNNLCMNNMGMGMNNMGMNMNNMGINMNNNNINNNQNMNINNNNSFNNNQNSALKQFNIPSVNNINYMEGRIDGGVPKDLIPRSNKTLKADNYKNFNSNEKINIIIQASSGMHVILPSPKYITIAELFQNYLKKINLPETVLNKDITFIFEANVLNPFDQTLIGTKFRDNSLILVIDVQNIISA